MEDYVPTNLFREQEAWSNQCGRGGEEKCFWPSWESNLCASCTQRLRPQGFLIEITYILNTIWRYVIPNSSETQEFLSVLRLFSYWLRALWCDSDIWIIQEVSSSNLGCSRWSSSPCLRYFNSDLLSSHGDFPIFSEHEEAAIAKSI